MPQEDEDEDRVLSVNEDRVISVAEARRLQCLEFAIDAAGDWNHEEIVDAAKAFEAYIRG